jgi:hypothetical protein
MPSAASAGSVGLPASQAARFDAIRTAAVGRFRSAECWDVFAWRGDEILFIEAKRLRRDRMRVSQHNWLAAAVGIGVPIDAFAVAEWDLVEGGASSERVP